jgi:hypothetical protein
MRYGVSTHLAPEKVIEKAVEYFEKLGLEITQRDEDSVCMEGGGGHVTLSVCGEDQTDVDILTEEWDQKVKEFIQRIGD